jgi:hypothetical protein
MMERTLNDLPFLRIDPAVRLRTGELMTQVLLIGAPSLMVDGIESLLLQQVDLEVRRVDQLTEQRLRELVGRFSAVIVVDVLYERLSSMLPDLFADPDHSVVIELSSHDPTLKIHSTYSSPASGMQQIIEIAREFVTEQE